MSADRLRSAGKVSGGKESAGKFESAAGRELEIGTPQIVSLNL